MPGLHPGDRRLESDTGDLAGVAKQVDAPRPERDALRRTAGSNPAAGTASPSRRSSAQARALTWYVRGRAFDSRRRFQFIRNIRAWRNRQPQPPQERSSLLRARARSSRAARTQCSREWRKQAACWPSKPVVRDRGPPPSPRRGSSQGRAATLYLAGASSSLALGSKEYAWVAQLARASPS